jgi:peroxiredoxin
MKSAKSPLMKCRTLIFSFGFLLALGFSVVMPPATEAIGKIGKLPKDSVAQNKLNPVDGGQHSLMSLRGKVVVLDFFGMSCAHSRDHIKETMTQMAPSNDLQIIGLESESSSVERVKQFIKDQGITYPVAQISETEFVNYVDSRDISAPQTLVFGRDGKLLLHNYGHNAKTEADLKAAIAGAVATK